jgi:hypothetical protein
MKLLILLCDAGVPCSLPDIGSAITRSLSLSLRKHRLDWTEHTGFDVLPVHVHAHGMSCIDPFCQRIEECDQPQFL